MKSDKTPKRTSQQVEDARESTTQSAKASLKKQVNGTALYRPKK
jgi:hypothetical protein